MERAEIIQIIAHWWDSANTAVRFLGIVPDKVIHQFPVEDIRFIKVID
jgi:hypothetical protein